MKDFKVGKNGKYYTVNYLGHDDPKNHTFNLYYSPEVWFNTRPQVENFITYVRSLHEHITDCIKANEFSYKPEVLIRVYLKVIESVSSGLDVRKWKPNEMAFKVVDGYHEKYTKHKIICEYILHKTKSKRKKPDYGENWPEYENYTKWVAMYGFKLPKIEEFTRTFSDQITEITEKTTDILTVLKNKDDNTNNS